MIDFTVGTEKQFSPLDIAAIIYNNEGRITNTLNDVIEILDVLSDENHKEADYLERLCNIFDRFNTDSDTADAIIWMLQEPDILEKHGINKVFFASVINALRFLDNYLFTLIPIRVYITTTIKQIEVQSFGEQPVTEEESNISHVITLDEMWDIFIKLHQDTAIWLLRKIAIGDVLDDLTEEFDNKNADGLKRITRENKCNINVIREFCLQAKYDESFCDILCEAINFPNDMSDKIFRRELTINNYRKVVKKRTGEYVVNIHKGEEMLNRAYAMYNRSSERIQNCQNSFNEQGECSCEENNIFNEFDMSSSDYLALIGELINIMKECINDLIDMLKDNVVDVYISTLKIYTQNKNLFSPSDREYIEEGLDIDWLYEEYRKQKAIKENLLELEADFWNNPPYKPEETYIQDRNNLIDKIKEVDPVNFAKFINHIAKMGLIDDDVESKHNFIYQMTAIRLEYCTCEKVKWNNITMKGSDNYSECCLYFIAKHMVKNKWKYSELASGFDYREKISFDKSSHADKCNIGDFKSTFGSCFPGVIKLKSKTYKQKKQS